MSTITVEWPERTIAQTITVLRAFCRAKNKLPRLVALVEGQEAERDAWRKVAVDYLTAKRAGVQSKLMANVASSGDDES